MCAHTGIREDGHGIRKRRYRPLHPPKPPHVPRGTAHVAKPPRVPRLPAGWRP